MMCSKFSTSSSKNVYNEGKDFTSLRCWMKARDLRIFIYNYVIPLLPKHEEYNLCSQLKRAAVSITANIAEGYGRYNIQESIQFYRISRASAYEIKDHLITCMDLNYISEKILFNGSELVELFKIAIGSYINYKRNQKKK